MMTSYVTVDDLITDVNLRLENTTHTRQQRVLRDLAQTKQVVHQIILRFVPRAERVVQDLLQQLITKNNELW